MNCGARARRKKSRCGSRNSLDRKPGAILRRLGAGRELEGAERGRMERAFGADFRGVRIHTDRTANSLTERFGAAAFTVGQHIAFGAGSFRPGTRVGDALLAHELAHTLQQKGSRDMRADVSGKSATGVEKDANRSARHAVMALYHRSSGLAGTALPSLKTGTHLALSGCGKPSFPTGQRSVGGSFTKIPSGNVTPSMHGRRLGAAFKMEARFFPVGFETDCHCGEYRQEIKGVAKGQGQPMTLNLCGGATLDPGKYQEDGKEDSGTCVRYGYRNQPWHSTSGGSLFESPDQAKGCRFYGWDDAGIQGGPSGGTLELDLGFRGTLVDVCNNNAVLATQEWTVKGTGRTP